LAVRKKHAAPGEASAATIWHRAGGLFTRQQWRDLARLAANALGIWRVFAMVLPCFCLAWDCAHKKTGLGRFLLSRSLISY
jgi:hypothetical protein